MANVKLPDDAELAKLFALGRTQKEIAEAHGATIQAVNLRFHRLGLHRAPHARQVVQLVDGIWPERKGRAHHGRAAELNFRSFLRRQLGDPTLSLRQQAQALAFEKRVGRRGEVLTYEIDSEEGWRFVPRQETDSDWVIRWPEEWEDAEVEIPLKLIALLRIPA